MQIVYRTRNGNYPFRGPKEQPRTFIEHIVLLQDTQEVEKLKAYTRAYRDIPCPHLLPFIKTLRDEQEVHLIYDYQERSLEQHLRQLPPPPLRPFELQLQKALSALEQAGLKAELRVENLLLDTQGCLLVFALPDTESLGPGELKEFYSTEETRLRLELREIWEGEQPDSSQENAEKHPGFIISGNELIFTNEQRRRSEDLSGDSLTRHDTLPSRRPEHVEKESRPKGHEEMRLKKKSSTSDYLSSKQPHRNSTGCVNTFQKGGPRNPHDSHPGCLPEEQDEREEEGRDIKGGKRSGREDSSREWKQEGSSRECKQEGSRGQSKEGSRAQSKEQSREESKEEKWDGREGKIQVTTEMVSKYKMKIVTCQEIEFEGKEGEDIEKLAQAKLLQYQSHHGYPQIMFEGEPDPELEPVPDHEDPAHQGTEIMAKILRAKEKASNVLKEYARNRKK